MSSQSAVLVSALERGGAMNRFAVWLEIGNAPKSRISAVLIGAMATIAAVALGSLLKAHSGGGEPLMAVFPLLMVVALRWGVLAGWVTLFGGVAGAWYVYLGQPFSFSVQPDEARSLVIALVVGALIIGVCSSLRASNARSRLANAASHTLADGLAERTEQLGDLNISLSQALEERTHALAARALSDEQFRASFEGAAIGKAQSDPISGRILRVNRSFADMLGYQPDELIGRAGWEFTLDEDRDIEQAAFKRVLDGKDAAYIREKRYLRKDGQAIWGRVSATIMRSPDTGEPLLAIAVVENIDEQYKAKAALLAANQNLQVLLEERTVTLGQRDLLLREVYHRVKNNLQIVDSLLVMQRGLLTDPDAKAALAGLRSRVYALGLVHHQLMGSKDFKTFDIGPFLEELSANLLRGGASRGVSLSVRAMPLTVGLDFAIPLGLIVTELVTNSLKHAFPLGAGAIEVVLERAPTGKVALVVSDDGVGADKDDPAAGNSLGMTIVRALVRQLGGVMTVQIDRGRRSEILIAGPVTP